jgi:TPP-dependent pyruvate/acetoin dehydrogenase alpha subunit
MLVNNNTQAVSTIQKITRPDMDPANAAASTLYSGALQAAQQSVTLPAAQKDLDKAGDRIDEAFAKTRVQLQASTAATTATTDVPATGSTTSAARADFTDYMSKTPAERIREQLLKEQGLTEADVQNMTQEKQDAISKQVAERLKQQQEQQVAAKTTDPQAQTVKETLAAI